jgi:signal transduction histidine kinase
VQEDVQLAQTMYELTRKAIHLNEARNKGAEDERQRIVRDLHDDVGAKLITIIHRAGTTQVADLCRSALQDIRDIMSYLGGGMYPLLAMIADWRNEVNARCEAAGINAVWQQQHAIPNFDIDSRTRMNLTRVMRESVTNAIKHAEPTELNIGIDYLDRQFYVTVMDDGKAMHINQFIKGRGLHNMRDRMREIQGSIEWLQNQPHGCIVNISFSLSGEETK